MGPAIAAVFGGARHGRAALTCRVSASLRCGTASVPCVTTGAGQARLTRREREVVDAACSGATVREVAASLGIGVRTVEHHLTSAYRKLGVRSRVEMLAQRGAASAPTPGTRYAVLAGSGVAYQVVGDGARDVVFVPGFVSNVEASWSWPAHAQFLTRLARGRRLVVFDKRGTGLSDRLPTPAGATLDERVDEVRAVMDALGTRRATLFGFSEGAALSMLFAASYPDRVNGLILYGALVSASFHEPGTGLARVAADPETTRGEYLRHWGTGRILSAGVPSAAGDPQLREHLARFERSGAGPGDAHATSRMAAALEVRSLVPAVLMPSLVLHRRDDRLVPVANSRYLADHLPQARYVELEGSDHPPWLGAGRQLWHELDRFLAAEHRAQRGPATALTTLLFTRPALPPACRSLLAACQGRPVATCRGPGYAFEGPLRAIRFAAAVQRAEGGARSAVHCGEATVTSSGLSGPAVEVADAALDAAAPGHLLVTRSVTELLLGSEVTFQPLALLRLPALGTAVELFGVTGG